MSTDPKTNNLAWSIDQYGRASIPGMDPPAPLDGRNLNWKTDPTGRTIIPGMEDPVQAEPEVDDLTFWDQGYDVEAIRKSAGLDEEDAQKLYKLGAKGNPEIYAKYLKILNEGHNSIESSAPVSTKKSTSSYSSISITPEVYNQFINKDAGVLKNCGLLHVAKQKTPAGSKSHLEDLGRLGANIRLAGNMVSNAIVGAATAIPHWAEDLLSRGGAALSKALHKYTDAIMSNAWIKCLSTNVMGSIRQAVNFITGQIQNFLNKMFDLFKGMISLIMQATAMINALISGIQFFIRDRFLSGILGILISFICPLLKFFQKLMSDLNFFGSIMSNIDSTLFALSSMQSVTNIGSVIMNKAMGGAGGRLPIAGGRVVDFIANINNIPQMLHGQLQKAINVAGAIQNYCDGIADFLTGEYGPGAALTDIGPRRPYKGNWHRGAGTRYNSSNSFLSLLTRDPRNPNLKYTKYGVPSTRRDGSSNLILNISDLRLKLFYQSNTKTGGVSNKDAQTFLSMLRRPF